ncbi:MAG TPA: ATP-binding protein [Vicinamibacteria bacterium]|nr:ATP-binding protein [Vicinamibacteria bacterium]
MTESLVALADVPGDPAGYAPREAGPHERLDAVRAAGRTGAVDVIEIGARRAACGGLLLWVEDRGPGVAAADLSHALEPCFEAKVDGAGLGLAVARAAVEALGGTLRIGSRDGEGTRVEIDLPATAPTAARRTEAPPTPALTPP